MKQNPFGTADKGIEYYTALNTCIPSPNIDKIDKQNPFGAADKGIEY